jgi:hypothetical protein
MEDEITTQDLRGLVRDDSIMFEYDVHDMKRAVAWYKEMLGLNVVFQGGECHTEFALPVKGARLALSLVDKGKKTSKTVGYSSRLLTLAPLKLGS